MNYLKSCFLIITIIISFSFNGFASEILTGDWSGSKKSELSFLTLKVKNSEITGKICEREDHDCMEIKGVSFKEGLLSFHYSFNEGKKKFVIQVSLNLSNDENNLKGYATLGDMKFNLSFLRR
ncbi:MAG: hypothetical protein GY714_21235 [Desulfobacterales bacterium]|nr:hypothetical protein [Desulfobacterales bacterium]MCP4159290.1 hypothetical protein [Deltaproteobacteria bacterium]